MSLNLKNLTRFTYLVAAIFCSSCAKPEEERATVYLVRGRILFAGQPVADAKVVFCPRNENTTGTDKPTGITDAGGWFKLGTYEAEDGAPLGEYTITVSRVTTDSGKSDPVHLLPIRYVRPTTSDLRARIRPQPNELGDIKLTK